MTKCLTPKEIKIHHTANIKKELLKHLSFRVCNFVLDGSLDLFPEFVTSFLVILEERIDNHASGCLAHPLEQGEVTEGISTEDLKHLKRLVADILNEMAHVLGYDADISSDVVECTSIALGGEYCNTRAATDKVRPFISNWVPVHLAKSSRLNDGVCGRHGLGDGEVACVGDADLAAGGHLGLLVEHAVGELVFGLLDILASRSLVRDGARFGALEDVLLFLGEVVEELGGEMEVFGNNGLWCVGKPIGQDEGGLLRKATVIKNEKKFGTVLTETLERMRYAAGEVPEIALLEVVDEVAAFVVKSSNANLSFKDVCPLGLLVPVKLTNNSLVKSHVDAGQLNASGQLANGSLSSPAALLNARVRVRKAPAHVGDIAMISAGRTDHIRALTGAFRVIRT